MSRTRLPALKPVTRFPRDRWMVAYADMITLLFACFVSLYATRLTFIAPTTEARAGRLPGADLSRTDGGRVPLPATGAGVDAGLWQALQHVVARAADLGALELSADTRGVVISLPEAGSFPVGNADMSPAAERVILDLASVLRSVPNAVRIEGHTDDVPVHTASFTSNWDLSTARATRVVQFFIARGGLVPLRLSAAGYGEFRPRTSNDSPEGRARNRRVDIVILSPATESAQEPSIRPR
jgi:chemotaxis protein MotB